MIADGAQLVVAFATEYGSAALVVLGLAIAIGLGIWGTIKIVRMFRQAASDRAYDRAYADMPVPVGRLGGWTPKS